MSAPMTERERLLEEAILNAYGAAFPGWTYDGDPVRAVLLLASYAREARETEERVWGNSSDRIEPL